MKALREDWLTQGLVDFEYKKYILLAYLQEVKGSFDQIKLYPSFADLIFHYQNLIRVKENKTLIFDAFPKQISRTDFKKLSISYKRIVEDDDVMKEIEDIIMFALPKVKALLEDGKEIYEFVESNFEIEPVGVCPLYADEGYLLISAPPKKETNVFRYQLTFFENAEEKLRGLNTTFIETTPTSQWITHESIKRDLIRKFKDLPNPATYSLYAKLNFPFDNTLMPIAKRFLVKHLVSRG